MMDLGDKLDFIGYIFLSAVYLINEFRKWRLKKNSKHKVKSRLDFDAALTASIDNILWQMLSLYRSSRCFVMQFHNGDEYYTGQSRIRVTVTNEVVYPGIRKISPDYNGAQVSDGLHKLMRDIKALDHMYIPFQDFVKEDDSLFDEMNVHEIKSFMMIRLADSRTNDTVALLVLHFPFNNPLDKKQIGTLMQSKKRLEAIFDRL